MIAVAQIIVRNLEEDVRDRLREIAAAHGRSMEEEVREILRAAVLKADAPATKGLGSRWVERFGGCALDEGVEELRGQPGRAADFEG